MVINGDGTITGLTAGGLPDATITQPELAANVAGNGPAFSAYKSSSQSVTTNVFTKITFDTEEFDTNSNFASSTFQPTVAGYYQVNALVYLQASGGMVRVLATLYKNGSTYKFGNDNVPVSATEGRGMVSTLVYLNGTTDTIELYLLCTATTPLAVSGRDNTWFNASMVRAA
jgi:hypothetical protein